MANGTVSIQQLIDAGLDTDTIEQVTMNGGFTADSTINRDNVPIDTLEGRLKKLGFDVPILYAGGIVYAANDRTKTVDELGVIYAPLPSALPFTTDGAFSNDAAKFFTVQGFARGVSIPTLDDLISDVTIPVGSLVDSSEYNTGSGVGAGMYEKVSADPGNPLRNPPTLDNNWLLLLPALEGVELASQWGVIMDGVTDGFAACQAILDSFIDPGDLVTGGGGALQLSGGKLRLSEPLTPKCRNTTIAGTGYRNVQSGTAERNDLGPTSIEPDIGIKCFKIDLVHPINGLYMHDFACSGQDNNSIAFSFESTANSFRRDITIQRVSASDFASVISLTRVGSSEPSVGMLRVLNCNFVGNSTIFADVTDTQWNGLSIIGGDMGNNGSGIKVRAHNLNINGCILEGQENPITVVGSFRGLNIWGNYTELPTGDATILLDSVNSGFVVEGMAYLDDSAPTDQRVVVRRSGRGRVDVGMWPEQAYFMNMEPKGDLNSGSDSPFSAIDSSADINLSVPPDYIDVEFDVINTGRIISPVSGLPMLAEEYITTGTGIRTFVHAGLTGNAGEWVVSTFLLEVGDMESPPFVSMRVNQSGSSPSIDYNSARLDGFYISDTQLVITQAVRLTGPMTSFEVFMYPQGISPTPGLVTRFTRPTVYTVDDVNKIKHWIPAEIHRSNTTGPAGGDWVDGDRIYRDTVFSGGTEGIVCTASGNPGTWNAFGTIA